MAGQKQQTARRTGTAQPLGQTKRGRLSLGGGTGGRGGRIGGKTIPSASKSAKRRSSGIGGRGGLLLPEQ